MSTSRTKMSLTLWRVLALVGALILLFAVAGCGAEPTPTDVAVAPTEPPAATEAPTEPPAATEAPTEPPAPTDTAEPTDVPEPTDTATPEVVEVDDSACIACHTSQETLQALAEEEEEPEVESEGEG
jgi:hypothetical protein